jgi:hypothetical protein
MAQEKGLNQAIILIKAGKKSEALPILMAIPRTDPEKELAWLWLSECFDKSQQKRWCFEQALNLNPNNEQAKKALKQIEFDRSHRKKYIYFTRTSSKKFYIALKLLNDVSFEIIHNPYPLDDSENYLVSFRPEQTELFYLFHSLLYNLMYESSFIKFNVYGFDIIQLFRFCDAKETRSHWYDRDWSENKKAAFDNAIKLLTDYYGLSEKYDLYPFLKKDILDKYGISENLEDMAAGPSLEILPGYKEKIKQIEHEMIMRNELPSKWISEQDMFRIIRNEYSDAIFQYTAKWISPQHIDVFIPSINCAFEFQGIQHFMNIRYFGGEEEFKQRVLLDERKRTLCKNNGIRLIEWHYSEPITKSVLSRKLTEVLKHH